MKHLLLALFAAALTFAQEPSPACPEPLPGSPVTITIAWQDAIDPEQQVVTLEMPAASSETLNRFVAHNCQKYSKDVTGRLTGTVGAEVPERLRAINLILESYQGLIDNITAMNPKLFGSSEVRIAKEATDVEQAKLDTARKEQVKNSLAVKSDKPEVKK